MCSDALLCGLIALFAAVSLPRGANAHEGHAALPSTGAMIDGNQLLLSEAARKAIGMETGKVTLADLHDVLRLNARVELPWKQHAMVTTLIPGRIAAVLVKPGEMVVAGQELARVESLELESLQLQMLQAAEEVKLNRKLVERQAFLADRGAITGASLLETQTQLQQATAQWQIAIRKLRAMGLDNATIEQIQSSEQAARSISIKAPIGGVVSHSVARTGQFIQSSEHLFDIVDLSSLWIVGEVLETDISRVAAGMPVDVSFAGHEFAGEIAHVRLKMDESDRTIGVVIPVDNSEGTLRPGMFGRMRIEIGSVKESIVCPSDALVETGTESIVLLRQGDGKYTRRPVQVGLRTGHRVEIISGLFPGDQVIVVGTQLLAAMFDAAEGHASEPSNQEINKPHPSPKQLATSPTSEHETVVVQGAVELPTRQKTFAVSIIEGRLSRILVEPGQRVSAGDVLAEIDSHELRDLQLELLQAQSKLKWADETARRLRPLAETGAAAAKDVWRVEADLKNSRQSVASLTRKLALIGLSPEQIERIRQDDLTQPSLNRVMTTLPIRAPSDGSVAEFDLVLGQIVQPHDRLFEIHDLSRVWVESYVFERDAAAVQSGQQAAVSFSADPHAEVAGTVVRIAPLLNSNERVLPVWIELETTEPYIREGMFARVEISVSQSKGPLAAASETK